MVKGRLQSTACCLAVCTAGGGDGERVLPVAVASEGGGVGLRAVTTADGFADALGFEVGLAVVDRDHAVAASVRLVAAFIWEPCSLTR
jgi:hypothetical protein